MFFLPFPFADRGNLMTHLLTFRIRKKSGSNESVSLPGSLPRRRSSIQPTKIISSLEAEDIGKQLNISQILYMLVTITLLPTN